MSKIAKNMLPYWKSVIIILALLVVQAMCDLALPSYTSDIIDVGIQNSGVEHVVPEKITEEELQTAQFIMTDDEADVWKNLYKEKDGYYELKDLSEDKLNQADEELTVPLIMNYQMSAMEVDTFKKSIAAQMGMDEAQLADMSVEQIGQMMHVELESFMQEKEDDDGNTKMVECVDVRSVFSAMLQSGTMTKDQLLSMRDDMEDTIDAMGSSLVKSMGVAYAVSADKAAGVDIDQVQKDYLWMSGLKMVGMALLMGVVTVLVGFFASRVGAGIGRDLRDKVFKRVVRFSNAEMDGFSTASLITRSTNDIQQIQFLTVMILRIVLYAPVMAIVGILKVSKTNVDMFWIIGLAVLLIVMVVAVLFIVVMPKFKIVQNMVDKLNLVSREILTGLPVIRAFHTEKHEEERFDKANKDLTKLNLFVNRAMTFMMPTMMLVMNGITVLIVWVGGHSINDGAMQVGDMMAFIQYAMQIIMSFLMICMISVVLPRAAVSAERVDEVLKSETKIHDPKEPKTLPKNGKGEVAFEHVSFHYPGAEEDVLHDITFTAKPGETTAFIGSTGCGKSTLVNLIPRFYDVTEGKITIDGQDVRDLTQHELREKLGYVPQKGVLFSGNIASNIMFGNPAGSEQEMTEAAQIAQAVEFIDTKPERYKSPISQGGANVSGGQKQRLSIARAIAKHPDVYIFDDSFSALDYKTDTVLRSALKEKTTDSVVLIVAQRISTILHAEQIIVLDDGKIVGKGTHEELLKTCDAYYQIAASQLSESELKEAMKEED